MPRWRSSGTPRASSRSADDLQCIASYGFRGRGAAGDRLRLEPSAAHATARVPTYRLRDPRPRRRARAMRAKTGGPEGTRIEVSDLFEAVPRAAEVPEVGDDRMGTRVGLAGARGVGASPRPLRRAARRQARDRVARRRTTLEDRVEQRARESRKPPVLVPASHTAEGRLCASTDWCPGPTSTRARPPASASS